MKKTDKVLYEALIKNNVLSHSDMDMHLGSAEARNESLKTYLLESSLVSEQQILVSLSQISRLEIVSLLDIEVEQSLIDRVPVKIVWYYKFMPLRLEGNVLTIACADPLDVKVQDEIRMHLGLEVSVVLAEEGELMDTLKEYYGFASDTIEKIMGEDFDESSAVAIDNGQWVEDLERRSEDPTVAHLVNQIILEAFQKRATDIHIEPYRNKVRFRYRIDGVLVDAKLPDNVRHFLAPILSRIKILANLSITEKRLPQDGSAVVKTKDQQLDLRISTMPTPRGESMVIRILPSKIMFLSLEKLGVNTSGIEEMRELIGLPHGVIFMTGPTGSGKTTTLYACLNEINSSKRKIITIEDPIEYEMENITQVQVNPKVDFTFAIGLRSILRHDPDIIMVGEVRDIETAEIAIRTALTGHLVFSTLHTNDAASGITRLIDMGVESYLVASSVEAFIAQRLVRVICPKCKYEIEDPPSTIVGEIKQSLNLESDAEIKIYEGKGCAYCNQTGYYGRIAIYEILKIDESLRVAILENPRSDHIKKKAMESGLKTLRQNGWRAVLDGITSVEEVVNVSTRDEPMEEQEDHFDEDIQNTDESMSSQQTYYKKPISTDALANEDFLDSRTYPRVDCQVDIRYKQLLRDPNDHHSLISDGVEHPTQTQNLSAAGIRFFSKNPIAIGSILELDIQLGEGKKRINCLGKVCRVEENNFESGYIIVTYYLDISSADKSVINKYVDRVIQSKVGDSFQQKIRP